MAVAAASVPAFGAVLSRLFAIQAGWNYERMMGVGFGYAAEPMLRTLPGGRTGERYREALARESRFFNAHPYLAGLAVGAAARAEVDGESPEKIERLRAALCGPLGSLGDRLIWAGWLPACAAIALMLVAFGARAWAVVVFLVLYNLVHVWLRIWGLRAGWREGLHVAGALAAQGLRRGSETVGPLAGLLVGAALPIAFAWQLRGEPWEAVAAGAGGALLLAGVVRLAAPRVNGMALAAVLLGATSVCGLLWPW